MKIAIVCDDLIQRGGAEKVVFDVLDIYNDATLYSSVVNKFYQQKLNQKGIKFKSSFLQNLPFINKLYRFYSVLFFHHIAFLNFDFSKYDLVISLTARYSHLINIKPGTKHICYMHTPPRMFWNTNDYFKYEKLKYLKPFISVFLFLARITDYIYAQKINIFVANSVNAQKRIKKIYNKDSYVINPAVDISKIKILNQKIKKKTDPTIQTDGYYLVISRLVPWKKIDLIILAFQQMPNYKLKIIGDGPEFKKLSKLSINNENIELIGYVDEYKKVELISKCKAVIQIHEEDFGLVPVEALSCGAPVVAFNQGGVLEVIKHKKTGYLFNDQSSLGLINALQNFEKLTFDKKYLIQQSKKFDIKIFNDKFKNFVDTVIESK